MFGKLWITAYRKISDPTGAQYYLADYMQWLEAQRLRKDCERILQKLTVSYSFN